MAISLRRRSCHPVVALLYVNTRFITYLAMMSSGPLCLSYSPEVQRLTSYLNWGPGGAHWGVSPPPPCMFSRCASYHRDLDHCCGCLRDELIIFELFTDLFSRVLFSFLPPLLATPLPLLFSAPFRPFLPLEKCSVL